MKSAYTIIPIWERRLLLVIGGSKKEMLNLCSKNKMGRGIRNMIYTTPPFPKSEGTACVYYEDKKLNYLVYFPDQKVRNDTIIHETNHIVKHMMKGMGAQQETEGHAYSQEWIFNWVRKTLNTI